MNIILMLIPLALFLGFLALMAFIWTIHAGQYEDLEGDAYRILEGDDKPLSPEEAKKQRAVLEKLGRKGED